jgi:AcrR family transcriptional regulator
LGRLQDSAVDGRERLLQEARRLFLDRGYAEVSVQEIAAAAEMTRAAPYYHFRDKEDLFVQVFIGEMRQIHEALTERLAAADAFRDKLVAVIAFVTESGRSSFGRLVTEFDRHVAPVRRKELKRAHPPPSNQIRAVFERAEAEGELKRLDAGSAYAVFIRIIIGQMELVRTEPEIQEFVGWDALEDPEILVDAFLHGV